MNATAREIVSINFDAEDGCYFATLGDGTCFNLPIELPSVDAAIAYVHDEFPSADIAVGDSAQEN